VVGYDLFSDTADTKTLKPHLRRQAKRLGVRPKAVIADAGYGSEENYLYLEKNRATAVIRYPKYEQEKKIKWHRDIFRSENWEYNKKEKYYICPNGKKVTLREKKKRKFTSSGYPIAADRYECESCARCRLKKQCTNAQGNRTVERNERWLRLKRKAQRTLESEQSAELRIQRSVEVETVFGQIKGNQGYRRFLLRGIDAVSAEWGLLVLGYNLKQMYRLKQNTNAQRTK
jgi:hypothetical protein